MRALFSDIFSDIFNFCLTKVRFKLEKPDFLKQDFCLLNRWLEKPGWQQSKSLEKYHFSEISTDNPTNKVNLRSKQKK